MTSVCLDISLSVSRGGLDSSDVLWDLNPTRDILWEFYEKGLTEFGELSLQSFDVGRNANVLRLPISCAHKSLYTSREYQTNRSSEVSNSAFILVFTYTCEFALVTRAIVVCLTNVVIGRCAVILLDVRKLYKRSKSSVEVGRGNLVKGQLIYNTNRILVLFALFVTLHGMPEWCDSRFRDLKMVFNFWRLLIL